jgi:hypothetical protein
MHIARGKARGGNGSRGNVELVRISFAPLAYCWAPSESKDGYNFLLESYLGWLESYQAALYNRIKSCSQCVMDFHPGPGHAARKHFTQARVRRCVEHCRRNATMKGYTGYDKIQRHKKAGTLRHYITIMAESWTTVHFDFVCGYLLKLVSFAGRWGTVEGSEAEWAVYFMSEYVEEDTLVVDGVHLLSAEWHGGLDNCVLPFVGITQAHESYNRLLKKRVKRKEQELRKRGIAPSSLPGFQEAAALFTDTFQAELASKPERYESGKVVRSDRPPAIPSGIMRPNDNVQRRVGHPSVADMARYTGYKVITRGCVQYYVMYAKARGVQLNRQVSAEDAMRCVDLLLLGPAMQEKEDLFCKLGVLIPVDKAKEPDYHDPYMIDVDRYCRFACGFAVVAWHLPPPADLFLSAACTCPWYRTRMSCSHHAAVRMWKGDIEADARNPVAGRAGHLGYRSLTKAWAKKVVNSARWRSRKHDGLSKKKKASRKRPPQGAQSEPEPGGESSEGDSAIANALTLESIDQEARSRRDLLLARPLMSAAATRTLVSLRLWCVSVRSSAPQGLSWETLWTATGLAASVAEFHKHINGVLAGKAKDLSVTVEDWIKEEQGQPRAFQAHMGAARNAGQEGMAAVKMHKNVIKVLRELFSTNDALGIETMAMLYGKPLAKQTTHKACALIGFALIKLWVVLPCCCLCVGQF